MAYSKQTWINGESPLAAERFNHMEDGIENAEEKTTFENKTGTTVSVTLADKVNSVITDENTSTINITIPETIGAGFAAEVNFVSGNTAPTVNFTNDSELTFVVIKEGQSSDEYEPSTNANCDLLFYCNGLIIECAIIEASV